MSWHLKLYKKLFSPPEPAVVYIDRPVYQVIEVKGPRSTQAWTKEVKDAIGTLPSHPGFIALTERLALQRQLLENKLSREFHKDLRETDYLQAGVFWLGYLQQLVAQATKLAPAAPVDAMQEELDAFRQIDAQIERIGMEPNQTRPQTAL
jgi:hypothetical protein